MYHTLLQIRRVHNKLWFYSFLHGYFIIGIVPAILFSVNLFLILIETKSAAYMKYDQSSAHILNQNQLTTEFLDQLLVSSIKLKIDQIW